MFDFELVQAIMATFLQFVEIDAKLPYLNELITVVQKEKWTWWCNSSASEASGTLDVHSCLDTLVFF